MLHFHDWVYRGPTFSGIWGYLSPVYYYLLFPYHIFFNFHPLSSSYLTLTLCIGASLVVFLFLKKNVSTASAYLALSLYSLSVYFLRRSLDGLNTAFLPLVSAVCLYACYKIFISKEQKFLQLFSLAYSLMIALHPSGFFVIIPFAVYALIYKTKFSVKTTGVSLFIFGIVGVLPYLIQEKKLQWWTIRQLVKFLGSGGGHYSMWLSVKNYFLVTINNLSLGIFGSVKMPFLILSSLIIVILMYEGISYFKKRNGYFFISSFVLIYYLSFGLLMKHQSLATNERWYFAVFIPLIYIYLATLLGKLFVKSKPVFLIIIFTYLSTNIYAYLQWTPKHELYSYEKAVSKVVRADSKGLNLDVYGISPEPIYYLMWYNERDPELKEQYFQWFKWNKEQDSSLVYWVASKDDNAVDFADSLKSKHKLAGNFKTIYQLPTGEVIYRIE